jgi:hypothetical protein
MRIRRPWLAVLILLSPSAAHAHDHFADACVAAAASFSNPVIGFHVTFAKTVPELDAKFKEEVKRVSFVGDFSWQGWDPGDGEDKDVNFLTGVRYMFVASHAQKKIPFVQVLVGGTHVKTNGVGDTDPAVAVGAGFEYILKDSPKGWGIRVQADYIVRPGDVSPRLSAGIAKRW